MAGGSLCSLVGAPYIAKDASIRKHGISTMVSLSIWMKKEGLL
nr:MAG TPA: hypothetical protein [Caudoviricetes sp.]